MTSRLGNQIRLPASKDPRARRNADDLAGNATFINPAGSITLNSAGQFVITLNTTGGLEVVASALGINLNGTDLALATDGLSISSTFRSEIDEVARLAALRAAQNESDESNGLLFHNLAVGEAMKIGWMNNA